jgi:DNA-binding LytR/AlgR family response regulator
MPTALIADDEPLLRERLAQHLARLWPELQVVAQARNGPRGAGAVRPAPAAGRVPGRAHAGADRHRRRAWWHRRPRRVVFVTAFEQYAVQAFEQGAIDYLVKPFDEARLADTVQRLQRRWRPAAAPAPAARTRCSTAWPMNCAPRAGAAHLQWIKASIGPRCG